MTFYSIKSKDLPYKALDTPFTLKTRPTGFSNQNSIKLLHLVRCSVLGIHAHCLERGRARNVTDVLTYQTSSSCVGEKGSLYGEKAVWRGGRQRRRAGLVSHMSLILS